MSSILLRTSSSSSKVAAATMRTTGLSSACAGFLSLQTPLPQLSVNSRTRAFSTQHHQPQQHAPMPLVMKSSPRPTLVPQTEQPAFLASAQQELMQQASLPSPSSIPAPPAYEVLFVRHGQSSWNRDNRFIGWTDVPLTEGGLQEAKEAGRVLAELGVKVDEVHTSLLKRCIKTAWTILSELGQEHAPVHCHWRLNERSYGALVGLEKKATVARHGIEKVRTWRRSYDIPPPPQSEEDEYWPGKDERKYAELLASGELPFIPASECLKDVKERAAAHWEEVVVPAIKAGKRVVVVGHENNLRALFMHIDKVDPDDILHVEIPRATPLRYQFDAQMQPVKQPEAAPFLTGQFLISAEKVAAIKERDLRQVYDLKITTNLEVGSCKKTVLGVAQEGMVEEQQQQAEHPDVAATAAAAASVAPRRWEQQQQQRLQRTLVGLSNARSSSKAFWISLQDELATAATAGAAPTAAAAGTAAAAVGAVRLPKMMSVLSLFEHEQDVGRFSSPSV